MVFLFDREDHTSFSLQPSLVRDTGCVDPSSSSNSQYSLFTSVIIQTIGTGARYSQASCSAECGVREKGCDGEQRQQQQRREREKYCTTGQTIVTNAQSTRKKRRLQKRSASICRGPATIGKYRFLIFPHQLASGQPRSAQRLQPRHLFNQHTSTIYESCVRPRQNLGRCAVPRRLEPSTRTYL